MLGGAELGREGRRRGHGNLTCAWWRRPTLRTERPGMREITPYRYSAYDHAGSFQQIHDRGLQTETPRETPNIFIVGPDDAPTTTRRNPPRGRPLAVHLHVPMRQESPAGLWTPWDDSASGLGSSHLVVMREGARDAGGTSIPPHAQFARGLRCTLTGRTWRVLPPFCALWDGRVGGSLRK